MTLPNRRGYKPPVRGPKRAQRDVGTEERIEAEGSTGAGPTVFTSENTRGTRGNTHKAVVAATSAMAASKKRSAAAQAKRASVSVAVVPGAKPKGKGKGKGKGRSKSKQSRRRPVAVGHPSPRQAPAEETGPSQPPLVSEEIAAAITQRRSDDPEKFASDMNLVRRHPLFPALIHTGNENSKTSIRAGKLGNLFLIDLAKTAAEGSDKTPMRDHALGKNPDLDNFLINWIRLLEAYQIEIDAATSAAADFVKDFTSPEAGTGVEQLGVALLSPEALKLYPRAVAPFRGTIEHKAGLARGLASLGASASSMVKIISQAVAGVPPGQAMEAGGAKGGSGADDLGSMIFASAAAATGMPGGRRKRSRPKLSEAAIWNMKRWMLEHFTHPYPNTREKAQLAAENGVTVSQVANWFTNARKRLWQPIVKGEVPVTDLYAALFGKKGRANKGGDKPGGNTRDAAAAEANRRLTAQQAEAAGFVNPQALAVSGSAPSDGTAAEIASAVATASVVGPPPGGRHPMNAVTPNMMGAKPRAAVVVAASDSNGDADEEDEDVIVDIGGTDEETAGGAAGAATSEAGSSGRERRQRPITASVTVTAITTGRKSPRRRSPAAPTTSGKRASSRRGKAAASDSESKTHDAASGAKAPASSPTTRGRKRGSTAPPDTAVEPSSRKRARRGKQ